MSQQWNFAFAKLTFDFLAEKRKVVAAIFVARIYLPRASATAFSKSIFPDDVIPESPE